MQDFALQPAVTPRPLGPVGHLLITGGEGFIGRHMARVWLDAGGRVTLLDDGTGGRPTAASRGTRMASAGEREPLGVDELRLHRVRGSVLESDLVERLVASADRVAHLAAVVGVGRVCREPRRTMRVNATGSWVVLRAAMRHRCPTLVASSSEVYGPDCALPFVESEPLALPAGRHPRASYAASKAFMERAALDLHARHDLPVVVARLFNTTGPGQGAASGMVLPSFCRAAVRAEPLLVHGDGRQTRCFAHVIDVARTLAGLLRHPSAAGCVVNVGSDRELSVAELAELVAERSGTPLEIRRVARSRRLGPDLFDAPRRRPDLARQRRLLGRNPQISLEGLIDSSLAWAEREAADRVAQAAADVKSA